MDQTKKVIIQRVSLVYLLVLLFGIAIIIKAFYIQFSEGDELIAKAQKQELKYFTLDASRGNIYSAGGELLATSIPIFEIRMDVDSENISDKFFNDNVDSLAYQLSKLFRNKSKSQYKKDLIKARQKGNRFFLLKRKATYDELKQLRQFPILRLGKYRGGLIAIPKTYRSMPFGLLAQRTIGYENKTEKIFVGLEGAYGDFLEGQNGRVLKRRINSGDWKPIQDETYLEPKNGKDVYTTLDIQIQDVAENALRRHLHEHGAFQGCAVLMEVSTGEIRAIANLRYDSASNDYEESYNYAIREIGEPGSTFKLASMIAGLEDKKFSLTDTVVTGQGYTVFYDQTMRDVYKIGDGKITIREAFEKSSNVGISKIINEAYKEDPAAYVEHLYDLGLNKKLDLEIKGEVDPSIRHPKNKATWYGTTLPWMSVGYGISIAPIQTLTLFNAIANNGKMVKPRFVNEILADGKIVKTYEPEVIISQICSQSTIDTIKTLLEGVVMRGTAKSLYNPTYKIAGKTGTAQIAKKTGGYDKENYNASFVGYFPSDNPKYSCIVVVNRPKRGFIYGGSVAAPVFKEIADKVYATDPALNYLARQEEQNQKVPLYTAGLSEDYQLVYKHTGIQFDTTQLDAEWIVNYENDKHEIELKTRRISEQSIPNVVGMGARDAVYLLENMGLRTRIKGHGKVKSQSIKPGTKIIKGKEITLNLSIS